MFMNGTIVVFFFKQDMLRYSTLFGVYTISKEPKHKRNIVMKFWKYLTLAQ